MKKSILVNLSGHVTQYQLQEEGYEALARYIERARFRLQDDPDAEEVISDLEQSIGDRFAGLGGSAERIITRAEVDAILVQVGAVDVGEDSDIPDAGDLPHSRRRLCRIREGQEFAGVCTGLAVRSDLRVDIVRTIFVLLAIFTGGTFILVYVAMMFTLPSVATREDYVALHTMDGAT